MSADTHMEDSGLAYCIVHHGVCDVDQDTPCDFAGDHDDESDCVMRPLLYDGSR